MFFLKKFKYRFRWISDLVTPLREHSGFVSIQRVIFGDRLLTGYGAWAHNPHSASRQFLSHTGLIFRAAVILKRRQWYALRRYLGTSKIPGIPVSHPRRRDSINLARAGNRHSPRQWRLSEFLGIRSRPVFDCQFARTNIHSLHSLQNQPPFLYRLPLWPDHSGST